MSESPDARRRSFRVVQGEGAPAEGSHARGRMRALPATVELDEPKDMPESAGPKEQETAPAGPPDGPRALAPGAPLSPGTAPLELARQLRIGEPLVWWDAKVGFDLRPLLWIGGASAAVLAGASAIAPEFWDQPFSDIWKPIAALLSPMLLWLLREQFSQRSILVTDTAVLEVPRRGEPERLQFSAIRRVRRDLLTGGIALYGKTSKIRIPAALADRARAAIASQRKAMLRSGPEQPDDPLGWLR